MITTKHLARKLRQLRRPKAAVVAGIAVVAFGLLGCMTLLLSHAATPFVAAEPEAGAASGNAAILTDSTASGGAAVRFAIGSVSGKSYYIDCAGSDTNSGTSQASAWQSLAKANAAPLASGDGLYFKRGCSWTGTLSVKWSNVTVGNYGGGALPVLQTRTNGANIINISGSGNTIDGLQATALAPSTDPNCENAPVGHIVGFYFPSGSANNTVRNSVATGGYAGAYLATGAHDNHVLHNQLTDNIMMSPLDTSADNDAGAFGVLLWGNNNEIGWNTITGSDVCSYDYTRDGSAVEVFNGSANNVHHNIAINDNTFTELGKDSSHTSDGNVFAYNQFYSNAVNGIFLNTRGNGNYGPITNTKAYNNVAYVTGSASPGGVICSGCGPNILTLRNNIIWGNVKALYASAAFNESNNIFWAASGNPLVQGITLSSTSKKADPKFVAPGSDYHLQSSSPAINAGSSESITAGYTTDLDGHKVPFGPAVDIGAYEFGSTQ